MLLKVNLVVVLCAVTILNCVNSQKMTKTILYNSSDLSYLSNGIQFPVPAPLEIDSTDENDEKMPDLKWLSTLFDHHAWNKRLDTIDNHLCTNDMKIYLENLKNGTTWAIKSQ